MADLRTDVAHEPASARVLRDLVTRRVLGALRTMPTEAIREIVDKTDSGTLVIPFATATDGFETRTGKTDVAQAIPFVAEAHRVGRPPKYQTDEERLLARRDYHRTYQATRRAAHRIGVTVQEYTEAVEKGTLEALVKRVNRRARRVQHAVQHGLKARRK